LTFSSELPIPGQLYGKHLPDSVYFSQKQVKIKDMNPNKASFGNRFRSKMCGIIPCLCRIIWLTNFNAPIVTFRLFLLKFEPHYPPLRGIVPNSLWLLGSSTYKFHYAALVKSESHYNLPIPLSRR